jgi:ferrochelatase
MKRAVLLLAHGTVESLDELPEFLKTIRRGHPASPELIAELRHRYEAIGGQSPLNDINRSLAKKLEAKLGVPVRLANRLARPYASEVIAALAKDGVESLAVVPLAQYSAHVYEEAAALAAKEAAPSMNLACAKSWSLDAKLLRAYADAIDDALANAPHGKTTLLMTAHSLPVMVVRAGDPYEREVRAAADAIAALVARKDAHATLAFQSQGMSAGPGGKPVEWLGPDLASALDAAKARGDTHAVVAPIGFLGDHIEILFDLDIEAKRMAEERGLALSRTRSLNDSDAMVEVLAGLAQGLA